MTVESIFSDTVDQFLADVLETVFTKAAVATETLQ